MPDSFTFGPILSSDYGIYVFRPWITTIPTKPYDFVSVPGQLGSVIASGEKVDNEVIGYPCVMAKSNGAYGNYATMSAAYSAFRNAMLSQKGYKTLFDSFDTEHTRKASFVGGLEISAPASYDMSKFTIQFEARPQRYKESTSITIAYNGSGTLDASVLNVEPILTTDGTGTIQFKDSDNNVLKTIIITQNPGTVTIDSQLRECYTGTGLSANGFVQFSDYQFPQYGPYYDYAGMITIVANLSPSTSTLTVDSGGFEL